MKTYKCACCKGEFEYVEGWTHEDCVKEAEENLGNFWTPGSYAVVCDDCYKRMMPEFNSLSDSEKQKLKDDYDREVLIK